MLLKRMHVHASLALRISAQCFSTGVFFHLSKFYLDVDGKTPLLKQCFT